MSTEHCVVIYGESIELTEDEMTALADALEDSQNLGLDFEDAYRKIEPHHQRLGDSYARRHYEEL